MLIRFLSDLHLEFGEIEFPEIECDLVILAGDIDVKLNGIRWILKNINDVPVIYIAGNHEYYGEKFPSLLEKIKMEVHGTNIHFLENRAIEIGGYRFFGATLWTDFKLYGDSYLGCLEAFRLNDYKKIRLSSTYRKLRPNDTRLLHLETVQKIEKFFEEGDSRKSIIVTHHAPSIYLFLNHTRRIF